MNHELPTCDDRVSNVFYTSHELYLCAALFVMFLLVLVVMEWRAGGRERFWGALPIAVDSTYSHSSEEEDSQALTYVLNMCVTGKYMAGPILKIPERVMVLAQRGALMKEIRRVQNASSLL